MSASITRKPTVTPDKAMAEVEKAFPGVEAIEKKAYHRLSYDGKTIGYGYLRGQVPAFEVLNGDSRYDYFAVRSAADLKKAIAAMRKRQAVIAKKATAKTAATASKKAS
jgi:hypothetical protein